MKRNMTGRKKPTQGSNHNLKDSDSTKVEGQNEIDVKTTRIALDAGLLNSPYTVSEFDREYLRYFKLYGSADMLETTMEMILRGASKDTFMKCQLSVTLEAFKKLEKCDLEKSLKQYQSAIMYSQPNNEMLSHPGPEPVLKSKDDKELSPDSHQSRDICKNKIEDPTMHSFKICTFAFSVPRAFHPGVPKPGTTALLPTSGKGAAGALHAVLASWSHQIGASSPTIKTLRQCYKETTPTDHTIAIFDAFLQVPSDPEFHSTDRMLSFITVLLNTYGRTVDLNTWIQLAVAQDYGSASFGPAPDRRDSEKMILWIHSNEGRGPNRYDTRQFSGMMYLGQ